MQDLLNQLKFSRAISPTRGTDNTAEVSEIVDTAGFDSLMLAIATGTLADADATFTVLFEDGDESDLSDNGGAADADLIGTEVLASFAFGDDDEVRTIGYKGTKRYCRATITPASNDSGNWDLSAMWVQGHARLLPQSSQV